MVKRFIFFVYLLIGPAVSVSFAQHESASDISMDSAGIAEEKITTNKGDSEHVIDSVSSFEKKPELITFVKADYPDSFITKGVTGSVVMDLLINESGHVDSVKLVSGLQPVLDSAAMRAASQFIFSPGVVNGKSVPVILTYEYVFTLNEVPAKIDYYCNVKGVVLEKGTRKPVIDAYVTISPVEMAAKASSEIKEIVVDKKDSLSLKKYLQQIGTFKGQSYEDGKILTTTDSLGKFSFYSIPDGKAIFKIVAGGFKVYQDEIEIHHGDVADLICRIERTSYDDYEIVVYGKQEKTEITRRVLQVSEAKRVPGFNGDVIKAVQALPGVARPVFGGTEIILRGADGEDNGYYIDGIQIPYLWHNLGGTSILNPNTIDNISLYTGGFGVRYGDVLGGIIEVNTRKAKEDRYHVIADMNTSHSSLVLEIPFTKTLSFIGSARREYSMALISWLAKSLANEDIPMSMYYWDYSLRLDYHPNQDQSVFCQYICSKDTFYMNNLRENSNQEDNNMNYGQSFKLGMAGWDWKINDSWKNSLRYGLSPISEKFAMDNQNLLSASSVTGYKHSLRDEVHSSLNDKIKACIGVDLHLEPITLNNKYKGPYMVDNEKRDTSYTESTDYLFGSVGGYLSCDLKPVENLTVTPEYRLDYYPGLEYHGSLLPEFWEYDSSKTKFRWPYEPSFRLSSRYVVAPKHTIKGSLGTYNKSPGYNTNDKWGNPKLEPTRGSQYSLGYEWQISDLVSFDMQGYLNQQWNKPQWVDGNELVGNEKAYIVNRGKARMRGLEFFLRHDQGDRFFGWLSYTLAYSERYDYKTHEWTVFDRNILNNIQLVASYNLKKNKNLGLRLQYTDGYPYTPATGVYFYDASAFEYVPEWGEKNSKKYTPYIGLDIRLEKKIAFRRSILTFYIGCDRLLHFLQFIKKSDGTPLYFPVELPTYNYDYSKFEGFANFPSPNFGLSVEF